MVRYTRVEMGPTDGQLADLSSGEAVRLGPHHFQGSCPLYLTSTQMKKIKAAHAAGKGCTLKFSKAQIAYCNKNGSGLLKDLIKGGIKVVTPYASDLAQKGVGKLVDMASNKVQGMIGDGQKGAGWLGDMGKFLGHAAVDGIAHLAGGGVNKPARPAARKMPAKIQDQSITDTAPMVPNDRLVGAGWLTDMGKFLGHAAVDGIAHLAGGQIDPVQAALLQKKVLIRGGKGLKGKGGKGLHP